MLTITVPGGAFLNEDTYEIFHYKDQSLQLEHSLLSISAWESKYHRPFLESEKTNDEIVDYIRCMTINKNVDQSVYNRLTSENLKAVLDYINDPMTATKFSSKQTGSSGEFVSSELIYYWMVSAQIPIECQKWHINRLLTLIRICSEKNKPAKKMSKADEAKRRQALNQARRAKYHSKG